MKLKQNKSRCLANQQQILKYIYVIIFLFIVFFYPFLSFAQTEEGSQGNQLEDLLKEALNNNCSIQSVYHKWKAAEYKVKVAGALPDPMAGYSYFGRNVETRVGPQEYKYNLSQKFPFPGKLKLKSQAQYKQAQILKEEYEAAKREVIKKVKCVYYDIFWVEKSLLTIEQEKLLLESLENVAQKKFAINLAPQEDVIKTQVEISMLIQRLYLLRQNKRSLKAKLNSLLNRPIDQELNEVENFKLQEFNYSLNQLKDLAQSSKQEFLEAKLSIEKAADEKFLASLDYLPDFTLGVDYIKVGRGHTTMPNDGQDSWMGTVAVNIPVWFDKLNAQLKEKQAALEASKKSFQDMRNNLFFEVEDVYSQIIFHKDMVTLYETSLVPQAEQSFSAVKVSYETGKVDFLNWLDAERMLLQIKLAYYRSLTDYHKSIAYLERIVGHDLGGK